MSDPVVVVLVLVPGGSPVVVPGSVVVVVLVPGSPVVVGAAVDVTASVPDPVAPLVLVVGAAVVAVVVVGAAVEVPGSVVLVLVVPVALAVLVPVSPHPKDSTRTGTNAHNRRRHMGPRISQPTPLRAPAAPSCGARFRAPSPRSARQRTHRSGSPPLSSSRAPTCLKNALNTSQSRASTS